MSCASNVVKVEAKCAWESDPARLDVISPVISAHTDQAEWNRVMPAFDAAVRRLISITINEERSATRDASIALAKPNYTYELLRLLVGASLEEAGPQSLAALMEKIGAR